MEIETSKSEKSILGYRLTEKIGSGGYGEVWSAEAPGGLQKAVKLVHGFSDEERAQAELKSLDRIKAIRHPFLLSLERIEVVDGQLVIVSELADESLADVFQRYVENGFDGIDREKLLAFLKDAADALDDLSTRHSLQHLDVKPENLLIFGEHVKLADFGLVKDVNDSNQSMVKGMTPSYAAPELFDGRPSSKSDQYALAIVFQEMLTGIKPFDGTTSAQLAAQHLFGKPNLSPLPKSDQTIIAKALTRDPLHRYSSCSEFIQELLNRKIRKKVVQRLGALRQVPRNVDATEVLGAKNVEQTAVIPSSNLPFHERKLEKLPPPSFEVDREWLQPVLVIGVGGIAGKIANSLQSKLVSRHGGSACVPSIQTLYVDSDQSSIKEITATKDRSFLTEQDVFCASLKGSEYYRQFAATKLSWLNRRWIYNIPRSGQTEGIRPLGRLVFADHFDAICDMIRSKIVNICKPENLATTSESIEVSIAGKIQPRVVVVGSINGGTGGMLFDLAYLTRTLLMEEGYEPNKLIGVLTQSNNSRLQNVDLANANAVSSLAEIRHYVDFGYPGDDSLGIPEYDDQPFSNVYLHELGTDLRQTELQRELDEMAEWIACSTFSNTVPFFDACRKSSADSTNFDLNTFGLKSCGPSEKNGLFENSNQLVMELLRSWKEGDASTAAKISDASEETPLPLCCANELLSQLRKHLNCEVSSNALSSLHRDSIAIFKGSSTKSAALTRQYDQMFGLSKSKREFGYVATGLESRFEILIDEISATESNAFSATVTQMLTQQSLNLKQATRYVNHVSNKLEEFDTEISAHREKCEIQLEMLLGRFDNAKPNWKKNELDTRLAEFQNLRREIFLLHNCDSYRHVLLKLNEELNRLIGKIHLQLHSIGQTIVEPIADLHNENSLELDGMVDEFVLKSQFDNVQELEKRVYQSVIAPAGGYISIVDDQLFLQQTLRDKLFTISLELIARSYSKISIDKVIAEKQLPPEQVIRLLNEQLNQALPKVQNCGGGIRLVISTPRFGGPSFIHTIASRHFGIEAASISGTYGDLVFCFEGEGVSLAAVAKRITGDAPRCLSLSSKVHCRNDVQWSTLDDLF